VKDGWFSVVTQVSSTNKTDRHYITEILLGVALNTINRKPPFILILCKTDDINKGKFILRGLTPLSTIFKLYRGSVSFIGEETGELGENHFPVASQI
jgi:hypothetical protein